MDESSDFRRCMFEPTAEVLESGLLIEEAGIALLNGERARAATLLREADMPELLQHLNTATGKATWPRSRPPLPKEQREPRSRPSAGDLRKLFGRDGWTCRFCSVRVIEPEVRDKLHKELPEVVRWGSKNTDYHSGIAVHMGSHDHVLPLSYGGSNAMDNLVVACWICQFARGEWLLEDVRVVDPRMRPAARDDWDGLRRILSL